jgi:hypothetical protein
MIRSVSRWAAFAVVALAAVACKSDKSTGPGGSSAYAGSYSGIIAGATTSGTLTIVIPVSAAPPARGSAMEYSLDAVVTLTGALKLPGGIPPYAISGSFDNVTGQLSGVTAGPFTITGGFSGGKFTGTWANTGAGTSGGFSLLAVPTGGSALALCGVFIGSNSGVWNLSIVGTSMAGEAASGSGALRLTGTFTAGSGQMSSITSPDDATVQASGALTTPANTATGVWSGGGGSGTWTGSASACN